ncbi:MAG: hypothetical protein KOO63_01835 [Bacteroidales bacterium]|nr:hypothetical protein [Candidatus Latescibacterota bacterium]
MKLENALESYYYNTGKVSEAVRSLALAGIGIIWVFRVPESKGFEVVGDLYLPAALFAISLALDLLHYVAGTVIWGTYHRYKETRSNVDKETEFLAPLWLNWPTNVLFWAKTIVIVPGFYVLIKFLIAGWRQ